MRLSQIGMSGKLGPMQHAVTANLAFVCRNMSSYGLEGRLTRNLNQLANLVNL